MMHTVRQAVLAVAVLMAVTAGCSSSSGSEADPTKTTAQRPAASTTDEGVSSTAVLLTEEEVGLADAGAGTSVLAAANDGEMRDRDAYVKALGDNVTVWPPEWDTGSNDDVEPIAAGTEAAGIAADELYGESDLAGCWAGTRPRAAEAGGISFGGSDSSVYEFLTRYVDESSAQTAFEAASGDQSLLSDEPTGKYLFFSATDDPSRYSHLLCGPSEAEAGSSCGSISNCFVTPPSDDGQVLIFARRGAWTVEIGITGPSDAEALMTKALAKIPE